MANIKVIASFTIPGRVLRAETPLQLKSVKRNRKGEKEKKKEETQNLYRQETIRLVKDKPIVINLRKGVPASQVIHLTVEAYKFMIAQDNPPYGVKQYDWKKLSNRKRLASHLQLIGETLGGILEDFTILDD